MAPRRRNTQRVVSLRLWVSVRYSPPLPRRRAVAARNASDGVLSVSRFFCFQASLSATELHVDWPSTPNLKSLTMAVAAVDFALKKACVSPLSP